MAYNILLYGATGFSGRLIAAEGKAACMSPENGRGKCRMILAARERAKLQEVAEENGMEFRVFGLDERDEILKGIDSIDVVVNAAGPFAFTAEPLAKAALEKQCHYVDINGEADVYRKLDDLGRFAAQREVAMVSAAGNLAAASDVLLDVALKTLKRSHNELGAVRIAVSPATELSRGSIASAMRYLREQVVVMRKKQSLNPEGRMIKELVISHEPVGKLERIFDFGEPPDKRSGHGGEKNLQIASAANLVDTLCARHTVLRNNCMANTIESYIQMGTLARAAYQVGGMFSIFSAFPWVRSALNAQLGLLPEGPTAQELKQEFHIVLLEIEDIYHKRLIDWRWKTPNAYQFTAQLAVEIARELAVSKDNHPPDKKLAGWITPAAVLALEDTQKLSDSSFRAFRGCELEQRKLQ